jgi:drug/metabolite transporter (DMT)-like permease
MWPISQGGFVLERSSTNDSESGGRAAPARRTRDRGAERILAGIGLVVIAVACFATLDTATKVSVAGVPILMGVWFRYAFQALATTMVLLPRYGTALLRTEHPRYQLLRGSLLLASSVLAFLSLRYMPLAEFTSVVLIAPLVVTLLAASVLKEEVSPLRWALVAGGFVGTLVILRPGGTVFHWAILLPLGLVVTNAWFQVLTSRLARTEKPLTMHFYTGWVGTLIASIALPFVWTSLSGQAWALLCLMGFMGTVGHFFLILAYQRAPASTLTPYLYAQIAFAMLGGWLVFAQLPDAASLAGMALIAVCGAAGAWLTVRERREPIEPAES